jgi:hypothetical protein
MIGVQAGEEVLDVLPGLGPMVAEMYPVSARGGTVAGLVNDFGCGHPAFTMLWDIDGRRHHYGGARQHE